VLLRFSDKIMRQNKGGGATEMVTDVKGASLKQRRNFLSINWFEELSNSSADAACQFWDSKFQRLAPIQE
jgi:hypothetical protein